MANAIYQKEDDDRRSTSAKLPKNHLHRGPSLLYTAPALLFFGVFALVPLVGVAILSFTNWDGLSAITFNGLGNWNRMLNDPLVLNAIKITIILTVVSWAVQTPICILLGTFMAGPQKYRALLGVLYFIPLLFSSTAVAITFKKLLDPNFGVGRAFGI
ncbi:MAG: sugar ABC transporter permease, partial [Bifidobacteriaceae bacterium]|nr:sugar ABC transporter permease [Bifidobacteriaceae bacterium]